MFEIYEIILLFVYFSVSIETTLNDIFTLLLLLLLLLLLYNIILYFVFYILYVYNFLK